MAGKANQVSVDIQATIEGYKAALANAAKATNDFASQVKGHINSLSAPFEAFSKTLIAIGSIAAGGYLFKSMIDETVQATSEVNRLAKTFGLTLTEASNLRTELKLAGVDLDEYGAIALKMDAQIRKNESSLNRFGLVTRDSSGQLLGQQQLLQNSIAWLAQFKEGTDRNIASQTVFGKKVGEIQALLKLTPELAAQAARDAQELGLVETEEGRARVAQYKLAINELSLTLEGIKKAVVEAVLPYLTKFASWFREQGPTIIGNMKSITTNVVNAIFDLAAGAASGLVKLVEGFRELYVVYQYLKEKLGGTSEKEALASIDALDARIAALKRFRDTAQKTIGELRESVLSGGPENKAAPAPAPTGNRSAAGLIIDPKAGEMRKLRAEQDRLIAEDHIKVAEQQNQFDLDLGKKTNEQFLAAKLAFQQQLDAIDIDAATKKRDAFAQGTVDWQKYQNDLLKIRQQAASKEADIAHQVVMEQQKLYLDLASSINSSLTSGLSSAISNVDKGLKGLKDSLTGFLTSLKNAFSQFAAQSIVKNLFGASSGAGGAGGLIASLLGGLTGHAIGGNEPPGRWFIAGEQGPELVYSGQSGASITPNSALGGGGGANNNITVDVRGATGNGEIMRMVAAGAQAAYERALAAAPQASVRFQQRFA